MKRYLIFVNSFAHADMAMANFQFQIRVIIPGHRFGIVDRPLPNLRQQMYFAICQRIKTYD